MRGCTGPAAAVLRAMTHDAAAGGVDAVHAGVAAHHVRGGEGVQGVCHRRSRCRSWWGRCHARGTCEIHHNRGRGCRGPYLVVAHHAAAGGVDAVHAGLADGVGARQRGDGLVVAQAKVRLGISHLVLVCSHSSR